MAYIRGAFTNLFSKRVVNDFKKLYLLKDGEPINYKDPPIIQRKLVPKKYSLGFRISRQIIEDDLYASAHYLVDKKGNIINMKKKKLKIQTIHRIDIGTSEVELDGDIIRLGSSSYSIESAKELVKAINMLLKVKTPIKKVVRRKRRVKK